MRNTIEKALQKIRKKERKYLERVQSCKGLANKIVVSQKAQAALTAAFARGLDLVLKKGDWLIRRGISETEITQAFHEQDSRARQKLRAGQLRTLGTRARQVRRRGSGVSLAEGVGLGVLGIGLPDIPIFFRGAAPGNLSNRAVLWCRCAGKTRTGISHAAACLRGCATAGAARTAGSAGTRNSGRKRNIGMFGVGAERSSRKLGTGNVDCKVHTGIADRWGCRRNL